MKTPPPLLNPNRAARLVRWAVTMLSWIALVLFSDTVAPHRHARQRYRFVSLLWLKKLLCSLALVRAVQMAGVRRTPLRRVRDGAPSGFRRRVNRPVKMRAILGSSLRKALRARTARERIARLLDAFTDLDGFARRYLVPRALRRLTKLCAIVMRAPPADAILSAAAHSPAHADTS